MKVLVIGGTGPTGPFIVNGLLERGHDVTILHSGRHELDTLPPESVVPHIHANPFDEDSFRTAVEGVSYDVVFAMYGRLRSIIKVLHGQIGRLISIGGMPVYAGFSDAENDVWPRGITLPAREDSPLAGDEAAIKVQKIAATETELFKLHPEATHFRYPFLYGPHQVLPMEWAIVRRALDRRPVLLLPDGGLTIVATAYAGNAAHAVLLGFDRPEKAQGQAFNVVDDRQFDRYAVAQIVADELQHEWEILSLPHALARSTYPLLQNHSPSHRLLDNAKIRDRLGYRDHYDPEAALRQTVRWQREHLYRASEAIDRRLQDPFDYAAEDRFIAAYRDFARHCEAIRFEDEPGYGDSYYGPRESPGGPRGSYRA